MQFIEKVKEISRLNSRVYEQVQDIKSKIMASAGRGNFHLSIPNPRMSTEIQQYLESEGFRVSVYDDRDCKLYMMIRWNE